ncbi:MAG: outer membrane protein assembly factor BamB family protein [Bdellovibrionota bacterium]
MKQMNFVASLLVTLALNSIPLTATAVPALPENGSASDWPGFNNTYNASRFSGLTAINTANVNRLKPKCTFKMAETENFQSQPIVVNGIMYVTTEKNTYAINAITCQQKWKSHFEFTTAKGSLAVNRGVAYANGKLFRGVDAGFLLAIDAHNGMLLWKAEAANPKAGESLPAVPVIWNGMVFMGQAGGDNAGTRGRMMAFNETTGARLWTFDLVPLQGAGSETWPLETRGFPRTGGATWTSYTLDKTSGFLYIPTGNPAPDFNLEVRKGKNLYTNSIVVLDAKTGTLRDYFQLSPNDFHDWDIASAPVLFSSKAGRPMVAEAGKDGLLHGIDLTSRQFLYNIPTTTRSNTAVPLSLTGTRFCPGTQGGSEWNGAAHDPISNSLIVPSADWCTTVKKAAVMLPATPGAPYTGAAADAPFGTMDDRSTWKGWITSFDASTGNFQWRYTSTTPQVAGVTITAGGLVFSGDLAGKFFALDAKTGKPLFQYMINQPIGGGVASYGVGTNQYIAVAAGLNSKTWQTKSGPAQVTVFGL